MRARAFVFPILFPALALAAPWPAADAPLLPVEVPAIPAKRGPIRVAIDPGHGAPGNTGNRDVLCRDEAGHMLAIAEHVAAKLGGDARFKVKLLRSGASTPRYVTRVLAAKAFRAEAIVSLHSDARGAAEWWVPDPADPGRSCLRNDAEPGIGVLVSDEGGARLVERRGALARAVARRVEQAGFPLYGGLDWSTLYRAGDAPGVFVDARPKRQRVYMLRQRLVPAVIVETHHALDLEENARWRESRTLDAFADALAAALVDALRPPPK